MVPDFQEEHVGLFRNVYEILGTLADEPSKSISRIGGGRISIPEDQANELHFVREAILSNYPEANSLAVMQVVKKIHKITSQKSLGGHSFDEWFWTNQGYIEHPEWDEIRTISRDFLLR